MSFELTNQHNLDTLLTTLKNYKRNNDKLLATIGSSPQKSAEIHLLQEQSQSTAKQLQNMIQKYQDGYLNPDSAKKVMIVKQQFKTEKNRMATQISHRRDRGQDEEQSTAEIEHEQMEQDNIDYQVEERLMREKGQSLTKVSQNILKINEVMQQTHTITIDQGQQLDLIGDELQKSRKHLSKANQELDQASKYSSQHSRKCLCFGLLLLIIACVILVLLLFF